MACLALILIDHAFSCFCEAHGGQHGFRVVLKPIVCTLKACIGVLVEGKSNVEVMSSKVVLMWEDISAEELYMMLLPLRLTTFWTELDCTHATRSAFQLDKYSRKKTVRANSQTYKYTNQQSRTCDTQHPFQYPSSDCRAIV